MNPYHDIADVSVLATNVIPYPRFKTPYNAELFPATYEVNIKPSLTVPDQSMTIEQILKKNQSGIDVTGYKIPIFHGEDDQFSIDMKKLDLSEQMELIQENRRRIYDLQDRINNPGKYKEQELPFSDQDKAIKDKEKLDQVKDPEPVKEKTEPK